MQNVDGRRLQEIHGQAGTLRGHFPRDVHADAGIDKA